jgi:hypothetical protein
MGSDGLVGSKIPLGFKWNHELYSKIPDKRERDFPNIDASFSRT